MAVERQRQAEHIWARSWLEPGQTTVEINPAPFNLRPLRPNSAKEHRRASLEREPAHLDDNEPVQLWRHCGTSGGFSGLASALTDTVTLGIVAGLVAGKTLGILTASYLVARFTRASLDPDLRWVDVAGLAMLAGIGFTVSLLIGELAFGPGSERNEYVKVGVLTGSLLAAALAAVVLRLREHTYRRTVSS